MKSHDGAHTWVQLHGLIAFTPKETASRDRTMNLRAAAEAIRTRRGLGRCSTSPSAAWA
ncbi:hypothetical protein [Streptomyces celluloflavus]|uniref:hypothetical protein n=1 Tax=Streptomyces celluloflavus TaxID=58344 RepID=UPI00364E01AF